MPPPRRSLLPAAVLLVAVAGCGAGDAGATRPPALQAPAAPAPGPTAAAPTSLAVATPAPPATPTASATPVPPRPTFDAVGFDEDDAIAFAAHYLTVWNHAWTTMDSSVIREISEPDCGACEDAARAVDVARARGLRSEAGELSFRTGSIEHFDPEHGEASVFLQMHNTPGRVLNPDGSVLKELAASDFDGEMQLKFHDDRWWVWEMPR